MTGYRCESCKRVFKSETGFSAHRVGDFERGHLNTRKRYKVDQSNDRRCLNADELAARGYVRNVTTGKWAREGAHTWAA